MGEVRVPKDALYAAQTQRAVENFPISGVRFSRNMIRALGLVKGAAAYVNKELGYLDSKMAEAIQSAAKEVEQGDHDAVKYTCDECSRRFPDDDGALLILAKARLASFYRDLCARDGLDAVRCLQKAIALDPQHAKAHRMLAEVLTRVGATASALQHLDILHRLMPLAYLFYKCKNIHSVRLV